MKKLFRILILLVVSLFFLSACGGTPEISTATMIAGTPTPALSTESLQVAILDVVSSNNVWAIFDQSGSTYWNQLVQANDYPTLYSLTLVGDNLIPVVAAEQPSEFSKEGDFYVASIILKNNLVWSNNDPVTAHDVAFTINTALKFHLGFNWQSFYDGAILDHVDALDDITLKYYFSQQPGLAKWKYGTLLGVIVNRNFWEPKIASAVELLDDGTDATLRANAASALEKIPVSGEPVFGIYQMNSWQTGTPYVNTTNPNSFFSHLVVDQFQDGTYEESKSESGYDWKFGNVSGTTSN